MYNATWRYVAFRITVSIQLSLLVDTADTFEAAVMVDSVLRHCHCQLINTLNGELNPICHLLALLGAHPILHIRRIRVKAYKAIDGYPCLHKI
jgi:hypothetical protein